MNRGLARRSVFEGRADVRRFLASLTCAVRARRIELHAFVFMLTHFHLLIRSLDGELSETMRLVQNSYVRSFNRSRRRDGPLMRGRFLSVPVRTSVHARTAIRYIDQNPVDARIVARPTDYPFGSARFQRCDSHPRKALSRALVDSLMAAAHSPGFAKREDAYDRLFKPRLRPGQKEWIEKRLAGPAGLPDELERLLESTTSGVRAWAVAKARLADGTKPGLALVDAGTVARLIASARLERGPWALRAPGFRRKDAWEVLEAALLRDLAGETHAAIARRLGRSPAHPGKLYRVHANCIEGEDTYAAQFEQLVQACLETLHSP